MRGSVLVRSLAFVSLTAPLLAGCAGGGAGGTSAAPRSVSATLPDGLTGILAEDHATIPLNGAVNYTLTLANQTQQTITYRAYTGGSGENATGGSLQVTDPQGNLAWPLTGSGNTGSLGGPATLAPGQSVSAAYTVSGGGVPPYDKPGQYQATAGFEVVPGATGDSTAGGAKTGPLTVSVL